MRQTQLFTKTRKEAPKDEVAKNAELLIRGGFINKEMAGVYNLLPLGLRVLNKIIGIIREEMNAVGGQEISMSALQRKELWQKTDRWDDDKVDAWFKTKLKDEMPLGLGFTHEEPITELMKDHLSSYRNLPFSVYQFQTKFRNETRAKSGLMRTREFIMKDLYSFAQDKAEHDEFYEKVKQAYIRIFDRLGLGAVTYLTFASGGVFSQFSHEFQTLSEAGEDIIYVDEKKKIAINKEVYTDEVIESLGLKKSDLVEKKAVETGNIFTLGTRFSEALGLTYKNEAGVDTPVFMGSYGIGPARSLAAVVELSNDEKGIIWPVSIAPFRVHLLALGGEEARRKADEAYEYLTKTGVEVLYDDRDARAGEKFADADLIGIPTRVVIGDKSAESGKLEIKDRATGKESAVSLEEFVRDLEK